MHPYPQSVFVGPLRHGLALLCGAILGISQAQVNVGIISGGSQAVCPGGGDPSNITFSTAPPMDSPSSGITRMASYPDLLGNTLMVGTGYPVRPVPVTTLQVG